MASMYEYYERQGQLPTFADFRDEAALGAYEALRSRLFVDKLYLPTQLLDNARILHYGPDSGEDSLVFARWGGRLTLVEPNPRASPVIREYFRRFALESHLEAIEQFDVASYVSDTSYDFIDAEGFIPTVRPISLWLSRFRQHLNVGGLFLVNYYEKTGAFIELCTKAFFRAAASLRPQATALEVATDLYATKWNSIAHTRTFESWIMDVHQNPFVRREFFLSAFELCDEAVKHQFELYSSWPAYNDPLEIYWHKRIPDYAERRAAAHEHMTRSVLSYLTGHKFYFIDDDVNRITRVRQALDEVGEHVDQLAATYDSARCAETAGLLAQLRDEIAALKTFATPIRRTEVLDLFRSLETGFRAAAAGDVRGLQNVTNSNVFVNNYGLPTHVAVFRRMPD